jgi:CubicO group peptidase (beta-lactamase class C family)
VAGHLSRALVTALLLLAVFACSDDKPTEPKPAPPLWNTSTPEAQGMDGLLLDSAFIQAEAAGFIDGLVVIKNGFLVAEQYYNGFTNTSPHNVMSVSKSFLSAIVGIALEQEYIDSLDERMLDYFPEYVYPEMDTAKYDITIRHLLTMRMGIRGEEADNYAEYWRLYNSDNWIKATIETPLQYLPGERMVYNTFQTHLLSGIITKATGKSTRTYATDCLLGPMKIGVDSWERDPQGYYFGGNSMYFTPQEMAVLGWLYLNDGQLNGVQIVPSAWVDLTLSPSTNFTHPNEWGEFKNYNYAYLWWLGEMGGQDMFMAYGYGGQFVVVFPDLSLVVVSTAPNQVDPDTSTVQEWAIFDIIAHYIVPAAEN